MKIYKVTAQGENIKGEETFFTSLKKAKEYMKERFSFYKKMQVSLFTLMQIDYESKEDLKMGNTDATGVNTRTTIFNM